MVGTDASLDIISFISLKKFGFVSFLKGLENFLINLDFWAFHSSEKR